MRDRFPSSLRVALAFLAGWLCGAPLAWAEDCEGMRVDWRFRTASPISPPIAVDPAGRVFVATHEGYVHGIGADGGFLWSYSAEGGFLFGVTIDAAGRLYAMTSDGLVYSLGQDGQARWVFRAPVRPESPLVVGPKFSATFTTGSAMHAVSSKAGLLWGIPLGGEASGVPRLGPDGRTWVATANGWLHAVATPFRRDRWQLTDGPLEVLAVSQNRALLSSSGSVLAIDGEGQTAWSADSVVRAAFDRGGEVAILERAGGLEFREVADGKVRASVPYTAAISATPLLLGETAFVPREDGRLDVVVPSGVLDSCRVADAALFEPAPGDGRIVVADASGAVFGVVVTEVAR